MNAADRYGSPDIMKLFLKMIFACLLLSHPVLAEIVDDSWEAVLIPLYRTTPLPGAHESQWTTEIVLLNAAAEALEWSQGLPCGLPEGCSPLVFPAGYYGPLPALYTDSIVPHGSAVLLYIDHELAARASFNLRARDLSRERTDPGTEVPVIRESEALTGESNLLNIPADGTARIGLRLYDFSGTLGSAIAVQIISSEGEILSDIVVTLIGGGRGINDAHPPVPSVAEVYGLEEIAMDHGVESFRVRLQPVDPSLRYWGFISITNNDTQHFTIVTPQ